MRIHLECPKCGAPRSAPTEWLGKKVRCNDCSEVFTLRERHDWLSPDASLSLSGSSIWQVSTEAKMISVDMPMRSDPLKVEELVDMTAMVDIVFFILIFFLVTAMQPIVSSMDMGKSVAPGQTDRPGRPVAVTQSPQKQLTIRIDSDDLIWLEEEEIPNEQDLRVRLREALEDGSEHLLVLGHDEAHSYALVNVLDSGYEAGFEDIQMSVLTDDDWQLQGF